MDAIGSMQNRKAEYQRRYRQTENGKAHRRITDAWARIKHREKRKQYMIAYNKRKYGITELQYQIMLMEQDFKCLICFRHQNTFKKKFAIDHDHKTGLVRGLLCTRCNGIILRIVEHEWNKVQMALAYLQKERSI